MPGAGLRFFRITIATALRVSVGVVLLGTAFKQRNQKPAIQHSDRPDLSGARPLLVRRQKIDGDLRLRRVIYPTAAPSA
ncbi:hypothetical protein MUBE_10820 [Mycobacterium uberis]|uniref:Uncharacterized protein n=1 Tax=Mycobacterium uberis TaxID=2162698 RepID=A0A3E1HFQ0_9MYCO|nr:hypothetical protein [Mycobacterium uberis]RFD25159.1 hypothetical protein MUBE_10820 [Mycobacterium uberis]